MNEEFQRAIELSEGRSDKKIEKLEKDIVTLFERVNAMKTEIAVSGAKTALINGAVIALATMAIQIVLRIWK